MQRLMSRLPLLVLVAAVALVAAAARRGGDRQAASHHHHVLETMNDQETVTLKSLVSQFEASNPDIKIDMVTVPFDQHAQKFTTAAQAGQAPDVMRADTAPDVQGWRPRACSPT